MKNDERSYIWKSIFVAVEQLPDDDFEAGLGLGVDKYAIRIVRPENGGHQGFKKRHLAMHYKRKG